MVPELAGAAASELADLRDAAFRAAASLPARWIAVGVGPADTVVAPPQAGTFAGYGADVRIALSPEHAHAPTQLPLCALIAGWLRGQAKPAANVEVRVYADDLDVDEALTQGRQLRAEIDEAADPVGVLIVADGANTLTPPAPGGYNPVSVPIQDAVDDVLARGHLAALTALPTNIVGRVAYQVLAGLAEPEPVSCQELYRGAPYGVGYYVGVWQP
ncbi:MAG: hypothetical protein QOD39_5563 [Mycobacterium sp.]|nr:hypothetical protein [Mycobacterium sp.]